MHLRNFVAQSTSVPKLGGGGVKQILAMRKRLLMKLAPKHIHYTQRPTVVLWEGRYITPHQLYQVGKYWWSFFQVNTTNMNNKCLPAWFYQMNYCRIPNALQCLKSCCSIPKTHFFTCCVVCLQVGGLGIAGAKFDEKRKSVAYGLLPAQPSSQSWTFVFLFHTRCFNSLLFYDKKGNIWQHCAKLDRLSVT